MLLVRCVFSVYYTIVNHPSVLSSNTVDFLALGIQAVTSRSFCGNSSDELPALNAIFHQAMISYVPTVQHIPHSVHATSFS